MPQETFITPKGYVLTARRFRPLGSVVRLVDGKYKGRHARVNWYAYPAVPYQRVPTEHKPEDEEYCYQLEFDRDDNAGRSILLHDFDDVPWFHVFTDDELAHWREVYRTWAQLDAEERKAAAAWRAAEQLRIRKLNAEDAERVNRRTQMMRDYRDRWHR